MEVIHLWGRVCQPDLDMVLWRGQHHPPHRKCGPLGGSMAVLSIHCVCPSCYVDIIEPALKPKVTDLRALQPHSLFKALVLPDSAIFARQENNTWFLIISISRQLVY